MLRLTQKPFSKESPLDELDLAQACGPVSIECRERFRQRTTHNPCLSDLAKANPFSKEAESSECTAFNEFLDCTQQARSQ